VLAFKALADECFFRLRAVLENLGKFFAAPSAGLQNVLRVYPESVVGSLAEFASARPALLLIDSRFFGLNH